MIQLSAILLPASLLLASGPAPEAVREAARKVFEDGGYQTEIPEPVEKELPDWLQRFLEWLASLFSGVGGGAVLELFFWAIIAVVVFFLARWLWSEWRQRRKSTVAEDAADFDQVPVLDLGPLPDPEALARAGEFAAAVHALLLHAHQVLVRKLRFNLRDALTSREVLSTVEIPGGAREELQSLVLAVEISRFGGSDVAPDDFDRCRERYGRFVSAIGEEKA